ncbi:MAG: hypothetical protein IT374_01965 [Polyangiaceae bacterium]|nr:hypothetical protein [Polyangiaceae bacterium]
MRRGVACVVLLAACRPELGPPDSLVTRERVIAVIAEPPESGPGEAVAYRAVVASPSGPVDGAAATWGFCATPKPLTDNNLVASACLVDARPIADPARAETPRDACRSFGPDPPPGGLRPRDPDVTGGFYQPVRVALGAERAFRLQRVSCSLPSAPLDVAVAFAAAYRPNERPVVRELSLTAEGAPIAPGDRVPGGATIGLRVSWDASAEEPYVVYDPVARALSGRTEALAVTWFVSGGEVADEVTGGAAAHSSETSWRAPAAGRAWVWAVLRDERGGVDAAVAEVDVAR